MTNGKTISGTILVGLVICALTATTYGDMVSWEQAYNGDVLPSAADPVWANIIGNPSLPGTSTVSDGVLTIDTLLNGGNTHSWSITGSVGGAWDMAAGAGNQNSSTIEFRARMVQRRSGQTYTIGLLFWDGARRLTLGISDTQVVAMDRTTFAYSSTIDPYQWHTYRFTMDYDTTPGSVLYNLYMDGDETPILSFDNTGQVADTRPLFQFGDTGGVVAGKMELDYIQWTNSGVYPAPEPATMALLGLGGLGILARRKR